MEHCNGFLVVRLPHENYDVRGRGAFESSVPHIENNFYGGVDRMAWFDVDEDHYTGALPSHLTVMRTNIQNTNEDFSGLLVCRDLDVARDLLRYSNHTAVKNELITIHAKSLTELKGELEVDSRLVEWIGYDVVSLGAQSLLRDGLFFLPPHFGKWLASLNADGLFSHPHLDDYVTDYREAARLELVEELPTDEICSIEAIKVGRVNVS